MEKVKKSDLIERVSREISEMSEEERQRMVREGKGFVFLTRDGDNAGVTMVCSGASLFAMLLHLLYSSRVPDMFWDAIAAIVMTDETRARRVAKLLAGDLHNVLEGLQDVIDSGEDRKISPMDDIVVSATTGKMKS